MNGSKTLFSHSIYKAIYFLSFLLLLLFVLVDAKADFSGQCGNELKWNLDDTGTMTISGTGTMYTWYEAANRAPWYDLNTLIKNIVIEDGATEIGNYAFYRCSNLTSVTIPSSVKRIGCYAFYSCSSLQSIDIPASVTYIGNTALICSLHERQ